MLQQYLPFTVLKHASKMLISLASNAKLQQYLPFTVLKRSRYIGPAYAYLNVATVPTVYGIETILELLCLCLL